jgi:dCTP diphosphatase
MVRTIEDATAKLIHFRDARNWKQFHTPKNLLVALTGEVGELAALLQWKEDGDIRDLMQRSDGRNSVEQELADIASYVFLLADTLGVDLFQAIEEKISMNEQRYPVEKSFGRSDKYTAYESE